MDEPKEVVEPAGGAGGDAPEPTPEQQPAAAEQPWAPPKEEWDRTQAALAAIANHPMFAPPEEQYEPSDDPYENVARYVDQRFQQFQPAIDAAAKVAGEKRLNTIFDEVKKTELGGRDFDRKLAQTVAQGLLPDLQDPVEAAKQGARFAAQMQEEYGKKAVEEYKKSLKRPGSDDLPVGGAGESVAPDAKSYDEVIAKWSGQTEV